MGKLVTIGAATAPKSFQTEDRQQDALTTALLGSVGKKRMPEAKKVKRPVSQAPVGQPAAPQLYTRRPTDNEWAQRAWDSQQAFPELAVAMPTADPMEAAANLKSRLDYEKTDGFSEGKWLAGMAAKGLDEGMSGISSTLAWVERGVLKPVEELLKDPGLSERGPLNLWNDVMQRAKERDRAFYQENLEAGGETVQALDKWGTATVAAAPQALAALGTAGMSAAAGATTAGLQAASGAAAGSGVLQTAERVIRTMAKDPQYWLAFAQVAGSSYEQAKADGASETRANLYAMTNGLLNAAVEVGGGIQTLPGELRRGTSAVRAWVDSMVDEGKEEVVQGVIERALQNLIYQRENPIASTTDENAVLNPRTALEEFKGGAIVGGLLGGGQMAINHALNARNGSQEAAGTAQTEAAPDSASQTDTGAENVLGTKKAAPETGTAGVIVKSSGKSALDGQASLAKTLAENIGQVRDMSPVAALAGTEMNERGTKISDQMRNFFAKIGNVFRKDFGAVSFGEYGVGGILNHRPINRAKMVSLVAVPDVIKYGRIISDVDNWKGRGYRSVIFAAPVTINETPIYVAAVVNQNPDGKFYLNECVDSEGNYLRIEDSSPNGSKSGVTVQDGVTATPGELLVEGTRPPVDEDIYQLLSNGVQFPEAMADDVLAKNSIPLEETESKRDILSEILFHGKRTGMEAEARQLFGRSGADPLQTDMADSTMGETTEEGSTDGPAARAESREAFYRRGAGEGGEGVYQIIEGRNGAFGYRPVQRRPQAAAEQIQKALQSLGVSCAVTDGTVLWNKDGFTGQSVHNQAVTVDGKIVLISDNADIPPLQAAGHEAFHFWKNTSARQQYVDTLQENILYASEEFLHYQNILVEDYFGGDVDLGDAKKQAKFLEELFAYLSGDIHEGTNDEFLRPMFRDYDAVKAAWEALTGPKTVNPGEGVMEAEARRLFGQPGAGPLQGDGTGGTMGKTAGQEETDGRGAAQADQAEGESLLRGEGRRSGVDAGAEKSDTRFLEGEQRQGRTTRTADGIRYGYRPVPIEAQSDYTRQIVSELRSLGVEAFAYDGELRAYVNGRIVTDSGEAATLRDGSVGVPNRSAGELTPKEIAAHEAYHSMIRRGVPEAAAFSRAVEEHMLLSSELAEAYIGDISDNYFNGKYDRNDPRHRQKLLDELCAYLSGDLYEGAVDISGMFSDFGAVRSAWASMLESGRAGDGLGAADAGFTTRGMEGKERTSRLAESMPYDRHQEAATGLRREDYGRIFRYESQTEGKSLHLAEELVYVMKDGRRTFLRDVDAGAFGELVRSLDAATAWNGPQMDAARMIQRELLGRSANMEITETEYTDFLRIMREHETATGQGVQANVKWERAGQEAGSGTELDAWENLQNSGLDETERAEAFRRILRWDQEIEQAGDTEGLRAVVMQVAESRGVLDGLTGRQSRTLRSIAEKSLGGLTFDQLKSLAYASTSAYSIDSTPADLGRKIKTIQVLNMLSSPKTAAKNLVGNTTFYGLDALAMKGAAIADMAVSKLTGTRSVAFERSALSRESMRDAAKAMQLSIAEITLDVNMDGAESRYGTSGSRTFKAGGSVVERALSALERNMAYLLNASDEFYKGAAQGTAERTQALMDRGKIKTDDPKYAAKRAEELARYRTFQDDSTISVMIQQLHDVLNLVGMGDSGKAMKGKKVHAFGVGDIVAPFTRVAGNLASRGLEYSPLNAAKGAVEIVDAVRRAAGGEVDAARQARGVSDLARGMTGTAVAAGFMWLAKAGLLRQADDEDDDKVRALNQAEGIAGTQLNLDAAKRWLDGGDAAWRTGDTLVDLSSIEPLNLLMNLGTEMAKEEQSPIVSAFAATGESFMDATAELPVMQSLGNFGVDVFRYGQDPKEVAIREAANTAVSSLIPNVLRSAARGLDDRPRSTYSRDTLLENIVDAAKNSVPGLRETLPGSVDSFGRDRVYQGSRGDILLNALLNPVGVNHYRQEEVSRELERVREETGETGFYPAKSAPAKVSGDGKEAQLDYEQRQDFQRTRGTTALLTMTEILGTRDYKTATAERQAELLHDCNDYAYQIAKAEVLGDGSVENWVLHAKNARKELGVSTAEYIALYQQYGGEIMSGKAYENTVAAVKEAGMTVEEYAGYKAAVKSLTADKDQNGESIPGSKKEKVIAAIDAQELSPTEKDWLYLLNYDGKSAQKDLRKAPWNR